MRVFIYEHITAGGLGSDVPGSLLREGRAMLAAVVDDFRLVPGVEVVTLDENAGLEGFADIAGGCDWTLVIAPEFDDHLLGRAQAVLDAGGRLLGPLPAAIELTGDKLALADFWRDQGVPHPPTSANAPNQGVEFPGRWIMKPRFGAGSQATFLLRNRADELRAWGSVFHEGDLGDFIVQPQVPGQSVSVALMIGPAWTLALAPCRQHLTRDGRFHYLGGSLPLPPPLATRASQLALQAVKGVDGLRGYVGVDLVLGADGVDHAIEINPRLTTSYIGLRGLCLDNLAELMLKCVHGAPIEAPRWKTMEVRFGIDGIEPKS